MAKVKLFSGKKRCSAGETCSFKNGWAEVPGFWIKGEPVLISIKQFNEVNDNERIRSIVDDRH